MDTALEVLRPTGKSMIMDCVREAGIDVESWGFRKSDGKPVSLPQSNGGYCYEWSFRSDDRSVLLLCIWFEGIHLDVQRRIVFSENLKAYADELRRQLESNPKNRNRTVKDPRINRAEQFSTTVQLAHLYSTPLRVVIVSGPVLETENDETETDRAIGRQLDDQAWFVESLSDDGKFVLVRGSGDDKDGALATGDIEQGLSMATRGEAFVVDQFAADSRPDTYTYKGVERHRDSKVRRQVLERSRGICELTGLPGFLMANGGVYLETHHIIPLSEGGPDTVENVIAISADTHRQAHYGIDRDRLQARCLEIVAAFTRQKLRVAHD